MFPQTKKRGSPDPEQKLLPVKEPPVFQAFSALYYLVCVSSTTVSIPGLLVIIQSSKTPVFIRVL
jgi:hypothetical protein